MKRGLIGDIEVQSRDKKCRLGTLALARNGLFAHVGASPNHQPANHPKQEVAPMPVLPDEAERARQFAAQILSDTPTPSAGLYIDHGVGDVIVYVVVGHDGTKLAECRVSKTVATGELLRALRSWAAPYVQPQLEIVRQA